MIDKKPPLIAHVIFRLDYGGLENGLVNLVNLMPVERYRHAVVCLAGVGAEFRQRVRRSDVELISLDKRPGKDMLAYLRMWRLLRSLRPDIVHTRNLGTVDMQWVAAAAGIRRRIHGEHGWEASDPRGLSRHNLRIRRACRAVIHRYVPMSKDIACWLERDVHVDPSRIRQIYSGVDAERFKPGCRNLMDYGSRLAKAAREGCITIGTVGRLDPVKNHESLIQTFHAILSHRPDLGIGLRLIVVGDGPLREYLETKTSNLGLADRIVFTGTRMDTPDIMRSFDVFVLPSLNEGISNTILEAMATSLPVVAARVGGNPELVADDVTGRLYDPSDSQGLERALVPYLSDPLLRRTHGSAARKRVMQNFALEAMIERYLSLYDEVMTTCASGRLSSDSSAETSRRPG